MVAASVVIILRTLHSLALHRPPTALVPCCQPPLPLVASSLTLVLVPLSVGGDSGIAADIGLVHPVTVSVFSCAVGEEC
jgi:hypothetical protein